MNLLMKILAAVMIVGASSVATAETSSKAMLSFDEIANEGLSVPARVSKTTLKTDVQIMASAPPLTKMFFYAVGSSNCGWEYMTSQTQSSTTCNHGGTQLRAAVVEIGYGSNPLAWMNGGLLARSKNYQTTPICVVNGVYSWPCPAGYTIVGFLRYYNIDGYQNGLFKYQNKSTNSPWNMMSKQISIL